MSHSDDTPELPNRKSVKFGLPKMRERVLEALSQAYIDQQLETEDYEKRVELAYQASYIDELEDTVYDFPNRYQLIQRTPYQQPPNPQHNRPTPNTYVPEKGYFSLIGDFNITDADIGEEPVQMFNGIGDTIIDLRAIGDDRYIEINQFSLIGDTKILVPEGMIVEKRNLIYVIGEFKRRKRRDLSKFLGKLTGKKIEEEPPKPPNQSVLRIKGFKLIGDFKIIDY